MFDISKEGIIQLVRGDTLSLVLFINQGTELVPMRYILSDNDVVYFALMEVGQSFENAILKKVFNSESPRTDDGDLLITLLPQDTEHLLEGQYYYTIKLKQSEEGSEEYTVQTLVTEHKLFIVN